MLYKLHCLVVKAIDAVFLKDGCRFDSKRAVDIDRKIVMSMDQSPRFDIAQEIQHFLRAADGKRRNDNIAAPVKGTLDDLRQINAVIGRRLMQAVAIGRFYNNIISVRYIGRITQKRLV